MNFLPRMALVLFLSTWPFSFAWTQQLDCQPCNDHYGRVQIGTSKQRYIQLKNDGTRSVRIRTVSESGDAFAIGNFSVPVNVAAGSSIKLPIIFAPMVAGKNTGTITVVSNAKDSQLVINVQGVGVAAGKAQLGVTPASLDFGSVTVGSSANLAITLSATGAPVTISSVQSSSTEFSLPGLVLPLTVAVGQNVQVTVQFAPNASGTASGQLTLSSNADNSPNTVSVTGMGVVAGSHSTDLSWDASHDPVIGYNVYRGTQQGGPYGQINPVLDASTSYTDNNVNAGATYYYVVTAVNADDQESGPSNEVKVKIPSP